MSKVSKTPSPEVPPSFEPLRRRTGHKGNALGGARRIPPSLASLFSFTWSQHIFGGPRVPCGCTEVGSHRVTSQKAEEEDVAAGSLSACDQGHGRVAKTRKPGPGSRDVAAARGGASKSECPLAAFVRVFLSESQGLTLC